MGNGSFPNKRILETIHETPACVKGCLLYTSPNGETTENELLKAAASLEKKSEHPLAKAVISYAESKNIILSLIHS